MTINGEEETLRALSGVSAYMRGRAKQVYTAAFLVELG